MDFKRAIIKCLFYDISPDILLSIKESEKPISRFQSQLVSILSKELPTFTSREIKKLVSFDFKNITEHNLWSYPFNKVHELSLLFLDLDNKCHPYIINTNALRWNETTRYVGEDMFTCSRVAGEDNNNKTYHWSIPIPININNNIEAADIHFHMSSSYDAFDLAWIVWMNNFDQKHSKHIFQAAIIRYALFEFLIRNEKLDYELLMGIWDPAFIFRTHVDYVYNKINTIISPYINLPGGKKWDYAISGSNLDDSILMSPYSLLWGERSLHEHFFYKMLHNKNDNELKKIYLFYYLYNIIKTNIRKDAILNNGLIGLKNFQDLNTYRDSLNPIQKICELYSLQTASLLNIPVEARFGYSLNKDKEEQKFINSVIDKIHYCTSFPLLKNINAFSKIYNKNNIDISYVLSISKPECKSSKGLRKSIKHIDDQLHLYIINFSRNKDEIPCTGIDFAGSDTLCRPFVLKGTVDKIRRMGCNNLTYHAGEDFFDLIDGIRTIDEILFFLEWNEGNRLGHCLSLFTDVDKFYSNRHYSMILPKGVLLDNLVWLLKKGDELNISLGQSTRSIIDNKVKKLYKEIYETELITNPYNELFDNATNLDDKRYWPKMLSRYNQIETWQLPKDDKIMEILKDTQLLILFDISERKIHIETCPTSNLLIGFFNRYDEIPTTSPLLDLVDSTSINTDIKGSVGTSLLNEYALVRLSLIKKGVTQDKVDKLLKKMGQGSINAKFKSMAQ